MYNFVSSPIHIFVGCQHTTINFSKRYCFLGSFSSGFDKFSPTGLFQKSTKPFKGGWPCIDGFILLLCALRLYETVKCLMAILYLAKWQRFVCSTKNFYYKCHRSGYFGYFENFSCEQSTYLSNAYSLQSWCGQLRKQPSHPSWSHMTRSGKTPKLLMRDSPGSPKVSSRGLIPHKITCTKNIWGALSSGVDGFSFSCPCQELKKTIERSIAWRNIPEIWNNEGNNLTNVLHLIVPFLKYCNSL